MDVRKHIEALGFVPKDGTKNVYRKLYGDYPIEIDVEKGSIDYGSKIIAESKTTQNFSQPENFVVLECVDRLLRKGYGPRNIILEKTWPSGHGTSGRLDICVVRDDGTPYMLVECKTPGKEFNKESAKIHKEGGQLFTYFQLSGGKADVLVLYASELRDGAYTYVNEIIKVEDEYRHGDVRDIYEKWNKLTRDNGVFDQWVRPFNFQSKALTKEQLKEIKTEDSSFIYNRFMEILRHNVVSDKGNAFNKIFTLFLCKVYDETTTRDGEELKFQWLEGRDNHVDFQLRLTDLYRNGMKRFLDRTVSDFDKETFDKRCGSLDDAIRQYLLKEVNKLRLEKNNEFAIKEVYDSASFEENARVVKEVVELLQGYRIRYNKRQQYLSDFFELLLTTGLKQETGQFFTPVPIAQFIIRSLPLDSILADRLSRMDGEILPYMIDYASGSGHFITEFMHEVQDLINGADPSKYIEETRKSIVNWQNSHFDWANDYVYGIEKDHRLVKVGKVGCYLHGDGHANVILSDGLADFCANKQYKGKLHKSSDDGTRDNQQFDVVLSNPPYSIPSFRQTTRDFYTEKDFELYDFLTDNSSEIECLFVERTKQLLKDGGVAGVILPSSILSNEGIYSKTREIILQYFDVVAIAELGGNTFMATNTNTVVLFLRRRDNYFAANIRSAVDAFCRTLDDVAVNGIEYPAAKYVAHVWEGLDFSDYLTLLKKAPNDKVKGHERYMEYKNTISAKNQDRLMESMLLLEAEKLFYFILAYPQKVVVVKSGDKNEEKHFLGYEFSSRRGFEGIHALQRGRRIDECTQLFDPCDLENPDKASSYIYKAFSGDVSSPVADGMASHVCRMDMVDMIVFDNATFEKRISLSPKKKLKFSDKWNHERIRNSTDSINGSTARIPESEILKEGKYPVYTQDSKDGVAGFSNGQNPVVDVPLVLFGDHTCAVKYIDRPFFRGADGTVLLKPKSRYLPKFYYYVVDHVVKRFLDNTKYERHNKYLQDLYIPVPPVEVQREIIAETERLESLIDSAARKINGAEDGIEGLLSGVQSEKMALNEVAPFAVGSVRYDDITPESYVTTDNMLPDKMGKVPFIGVSGVKSVTEYRMGDILVSNIRPYLKKIWFADVDGGCSKDVLVFRSSDSGRYLPKYIFYMLRRDAFFEYVMSGKKGVKMPRGNKEDIMKYGVPMPSVEEQRNVVDGIEALEKDIAEARGLIERLTAEKSAVLDKYL